MNITSFISPIIAIISIGISITLWRKGRSRKALSYEIASSTSLFKQHDEIGSKFKIFFEDKEIKENVVLVLLRIVNAGNVPIEAKDFTQDLTIQTTSNNILIAEVKETTPNNLQVDIKNVEPSKTIISPLLLNSKEEIIIKLLIRSPEENPFNKKELKVESRIVGISEVTKLKKKTPKDEFFMTLSGIPLLICLILSITRLSKIDWINNFILIPSVSLAAGFTLAGLISMVKFKKYFPLNK